MASGLSPPFFASPPLVLAGAFPFDLWSSLPSGRVQQGLTKRARVLRNPSAKRALGLEGSFGTFALDRAKGKERPARSENEG